MAQTTTEAPPRPIPNDIDIIDTDTHLMEPPDLWTARLETLDWQWPNSGSAQAHPDPELPGFYFRRQARLYHIQRRPAVG
jgi:hypothetical protein